MSRDFSKATFLKKLKANDFRVCRSIGWWYEDLTEPGGKTLYGGVIIDGRFNRRATLAKLLKDRAKRLAKEKTARRSA